MRAMELIECLQQLVKEAGNLEIGILTEDPDGMYRLDGEPLVDIITPPSEVDETETPVIAIAWHELLCPGNCGPQLRLVTNEPHE